MRPPPPVVASAAGGAGRIDARKALGQHFLFDANLCRKIARISGAGPESLVIEVGPGPGGLTRALLDTGASVLAVEKDSRFLPDLAVIAASADGRLRVIHADALAIDEREVGGETASVAANLPYNIATPLLLKWLVGPFRPPMMTLMFQKEVAERITAAPATASYGRLSVICQHLCEVSLAMRLPARAFTPPPKVASAVVGFARRPGAPSERLLADLQRVTREAFGQRRKMLRSALSALGGEALCRRAAVDPTSRAERLDVAAFVSLARALEPAARGTGLAPGLLDG